MQTILKLFYDRVEQHPDHLLYNFLDRAGRTTASYTYADFLQRTTDVAVHLRRSVTLEPGARVLLLYPPGLEMICAFFACVRLGMIPVPVYPPSGRGFDAALAKMNYIATDCGAAAVLTERSYFWSLKVNQARSRIASFSLRKNRLAKMHWVVSDDAQKNTSAHLVEGHSDILFLQYTSGSTNHPKGVMVSHENLLSNCSALDYQPVGVSWLPQYHDLGLIGFYLFFALKGGTTYGFSPLDFIERPALWLETIAKVQATASAAPNFAFEYCLRPDKMAPENLAGLDLSSLRFLMTAAEPVRPHIYRDFITKFEPHGLDPEAYFAAYGLAEFTLAATNFGRQVDAFDAERLKQNQAVIAPANAAQDDAKELISCGAPVAGAKVKIVGLNDDFRALPDGAVGEIWLSGASKSKGYWNRPELSQATFEARLKGQSEDEPGWLRTGDLGFLRDGEVYVCGRTKDLIIIRGHNYYPQDIEAIVEGDSAIRKGCVAAFAHDDDAAEHLVIVAELKNPKQLPDVGRIQGALQRSLGIAAERFVFIRARTIPKTSSGKIARHQALSQWLNNSLERLEEVQPSAYERIDSTLKPSRHSAGSFGAVFEHYGLTGEETGTLGDAGLDSLRIAEFTHDLKAVLEHQGSDDLSDAVDLRFIIKIAVCELFELLVDVGELAPQSKLRFKRRVLALQREHQDHEAELMRSDTELRINMATLSEQLKPQDSSDGVVLLTGGTGFFGPFILKSLLEQQGDDVFVLLRAADEAVGMERLRQAIASVGGTSVGNWEQRVRPICGDLAQANLGLASTQWDQLAQQVHTIYHNGALVNYLFDYATMRDANVGGTHEVIRLSMSGRAKVLNHISTTFIFGWSVKETLNEADTNPEMEHLDFGYSQSKWVSEQVVLNAMQQGLQARIFRPALLSPSLTGGGYNFDISIRMLAFMLKHRIGTTAQNQISLSPADLAADNIVAIASLPQSVNTTFHVTRDRYSTMRDVTSILARLTDQEFENLPMKEFVPEVIERCGKADLLFPLLNFLVRSVDKITAMEFKRYDSSNFQKFRAQATQGVEDPTLEDVVLGILRFMRAHQIGEVPSPDSQRSVRHV